MVCSGSQVFHSLSGRFQVSNGRRLEDPCGNGLELEIQVDTYSSNDSEHTQVGIDKYICLLCHLGRP